MKFTNDLFTSFDKCQPIGAIFIDLSKAFDRVDHYLLLDKLHSLGFDPNTLFWFNTYLQNRRQSVSVQGLNSGYLVIYKGVPQGSILGPLLFCLFINDLPKTCLHSSIQFYADDIVQILCRCYLFLILIFHIFSPLCSLTLTPLRIGFTKTNSSLTKRSPVVWCSLKDAIILTLLI